MSTFAYIISGLFAVAFVAVWVVLAYKLYRVVSAKKSEPEDEKDES